MKKTKVVNLRKEPYDVFIGRPSKWGNPFIIGRDGSREEVIQEYENWLNKKVLYNVKPPTIEEMVKELKGKILGCYCKPRACHGDIIVNLLEQQEHLKRKS